MTGQLCLSSIVHALGVCMSPISVRLGAVIVFHSYVVSPH